MYMKRLLAWMLALCFLFIGAGFPEEAQKLSSNPPQRILLTLTCKDQTEETVKQWVHAFNDSGRRIFTARIPLNEETEIVLPVTCVRGYFDNFTYPSANPVENSLQLTKRVPFTSATTTLHLELITKKWTKYVVIISYDDGRPLKDQDLIVYDVTNGGDVAKIPGPNGHKPLLAQIRTDAQGQAVFYGLPERRFVLYHVQRSPFYVFDEYSEEFCAEPGVTTFRKEWKLPSFQTVDVDIISEAPGGKREPANDIVRIGVRMLRLFDGKEEMANWWDVPVRGGRTCFHSYEYGFRPGRIVTFYITDEMKKRGYTKILSGETLKITPETKKHTVVLTKEQVDGEIIFAATDTASGAALPANLYYAPIGKESEPLFAPGDKPLALAPGKYQVVVFAPGYDCLPLTLEVKKKEKRAIPCKLAKSRAVAVSVKYSGETGPNGAIPGIYSVNSPAAPLFAQMKENPLATEFSVPFDPRLGSSLFVIASGCAPRLVPLDAKTPEKLEITLDKGVTVKGTFSAEYAAHAREQAKKALSGGPFPPDAKLIDARPMTLLFFPEDNHYIWAGGAKAQPGEPWTAQLVPGKYRMALDLGGVYLRLPGKLTVPDAGEMAFPPELLSAKDELKPVVGQARTCANDLFRRLAKK